MSVTIETIITCDGGSPNCMGSDWSADARNRSAAEQRKMARSALGWYCVRGKDYCPACWAARQREKVHARP